MIVRENMKWPPIDRIALKMEEHAAWFSGDAEVLANYYSGFMNQTYLELPSTRDLFWGRQIKNQGEIYVHVPIANDLAATSADLLFANSPIIRIKQATEVNAPASYKTSQTEMDDMLMETGFFAKIIEAAESCAGIGGIFIKLAWDQDLSPYPIPVVVQADKAVPEFSFGILKSTVFHKILSVDDSKSKVWRHLEYYEKGKIRNEVYLGTPDRLGYKKDLKDHPATENLEPEIRTPNILMCVYVPNILPNRLDRSSYLGRSDFHGQEGLMDSLDEIFSSWMKDIILAKARIIVPQSFMQGSSTGGGRFNVDRMLYEQLDMDPLSSKEPITSKQFEIRADQFEKTALNFIERIVTSAGYSPQSFGLNIQGRAESGTALNIRERKTFSTKSKKENYWNEAIRKLVAMMMVVYKEELGGRVETDGIVNVSFSDDSGGTINEVATAMKMIYDAKSASIDTRVRMLHPEWDEAQIQAEILLIKDETAVPDPDGAFNADLVQTKKKAVEEDPEDDTEE